MQKLTLYVSGHVCGLFNVCVKDTLFGQGGCRSYKLGRLGHEVGPERGHLVQRGLPHQADLVRGGHHRHPLHPLTVALQQLRLQHHLLPAPTNTQNSFTDPLNP